MEVIPLAKLSDKEIAEIQAQNTADYDKAAKENREARQNSKEDPLAGSAASSDVDND